MVSGCPVTWRGGYTKKMCENDSSLNSILSKLPVTDGKNLQIYKNIFCALCNNVSKVEYWKIEIKKKYGVNYTKPMSEVLAKNIEWKAKVSESIIGKARYCKPKFTGCNKAKSLASLLRMSKEELEDACNAYSFPVQICMLKKRWRNLHCMLCAGDKYENKHLLMTDLLSDCKSYVVPQTVVFDFRLGQTTGTEWSAVNKRTIFASCKEGTVYDPFTDKCLNFTPFTQENTMNASVSETYGTLSNKSRCMPAKNLSIKVFGNRTISVNGSIRPDLYLVVIDNTSYVCWNKRARCIPANLPGIKVFGNRTISVNGLIRPDLYLEEIDDTSYVCGNRTRVFVKYENFPIKSRYSLRVITTIGFASSTVCIAFLLVTYSLFSELKTTPGKSIMSLSCALLIYMACYIPMTSISNPVLCVTNAVVLHFAVLSVFFWLNVLAYDMSKRFGSHGE